MSKKLLIVGHGIAGAVLSCTLRAAGADVYVADPALAISCSSIAAGVINPVTGKRYAKSWGYDQFYPFAQLFYQNLESEIGQKIWFNYPIVRILGSPLESNEWNLRASRPEFQGLMETAPHAGDWDWAIKKQENYGILKGAARVDFGEIMAYAQSVAKQSDRWIHASIDPEAATDWLNDFDKIIFCEGHLAQNNGFFPNLPWQLAKGERLLIRLHANAPIATMLKKQIMVVPVDADQYWVGAHYYWDFENDAPTLSGKQALQLELDDLLAVPYQIIDHQAAVRPVLKDRRPVLGWSTLNERMGIFNGTGSKGALLAPYWAAHFAKNILEGQPIDSEVDVRRFTKNRNEK